MRQMPWRRRLLVHAMKKNFRKDAPWRVYTIVILAIFCLGNFAKAQTSEVAADPNLTAPIVEQIPLTAEAGSDRNVAVGRTVLFDGSGSTGPQDKELTYTWNFGDGFSAEGIDASKIYDRSGTYRVTLTVSDGLDTSVDEVIVSVEKDLILLLTDRSVSNKDIKQLQDFAATQGILLVSLREDNTDLDYLVSEKLAAKLNNNKEDVIQSDLIIIWTGSQRGLNALTDLASNLATGENQSQLENFGFAQKGIITVTDQSSSFAVAKIAQNTFNLLQPEYILLTSKDNLATIIEATQSDKVVSFLKNQHASYQLIGVHSQRALSQITPLNFLSYLMSYLINRGVPADTLFLILILPVIATIIAFARQIIGIKAYGIYMPSIMALIFLVTGIKYGLAIFCMLLLSATLARLLAKKLRILYLPRMAIVLTSVSLTILAIFIAGAYWQRTGILAVSIFPILIMTVLTEKFVEVQIEQGAGPAIKLTLETLILSVASYYIVTWETFKTLILAYPELIFLTIIINIFLGRFSGLRLMEYFRFRKVIKHVGNPQK